MRESRPLLTPRPFPTLVSLVIPAYDEEAVLPSLEIALYDFASQLRAPVEFIIVNDGSRDRTIDILAEWAAMDARVKVLHLSRNFGHQIAATAGLDFASGDAVVLLDADLQDPLDVIHTMIDRYCEGYDVVFGQRVSRAGETKFKLATAWLFYRLMKTLVYDRLPADSGDFRLISAECLASLIRMREQHRFLRGMVSWVGYPQIAVPYERQRRVAGETKYPFRRMLTLAWTAATSFSTMPLRISVLLGLIVGIFGFEEGIRALWVSTFGGGAVPGWTSLMVVVCAIGSSLLISLGVVGDYIGKIYEQVKDRPLYIVARSFNVTEKWPGAARLEERAKSQSAGSRA